VSARQRPTTGTVVVRERRVVYASAGAAFVMGREARELMGRVLFDFLVPEDRERISDRYARRLRGELVPSEYEMVLLLPDGTRRTVEAQVSLEGKDEVVVQLRDLSDQAERRGRLLGLAELGVAIQRERSEAAIHQRVREGLFALGLASMLVRPEPEGVRVRWARMPSAVRVVLEARLCARTDGFLGRLTPFLRTAWEEGACYADDFMDQAAAFLPPGEATVARAVAAAQSLVRGLAVRLDERSGPSGCLVVAGGWIGPGDVPASRLFAAQVAAALDSARAFAELSRRNFDLAALNRLGELAGGAIGLGELLDQGAAVVRSTVGCDGVAIFAADLPAGRMTLVHANGAPPDLLAAIATVGLDGPLGGALGQRQPQAIQVEDQPAPYRALLARAGFQTFAYVPLQVRSRAFGVMVTGWRERRDEAACRPDLLLAMGAHFAAAMESDHLLGDLRRRVGELTLLNDVAVDTAALGPAELLERALRRMCATFEADGGLAFLPEGGGLERKAAIGLSPASLELTARLEPGEGPAGLAMTRLQPVTAITEAEAGPRSWEAHRTEGFQALVAVPLLAASRAVGALCLGRRTERPFAPGEVALLSALGAQLGVAVDAARQHADTQRRARDLEAISSLALRFFAGPPGDVPHILEEACAEVMQALKARHAAVMLLDEARQLLTLAAEDGVPMPAEARVTPLERSALAAEAVRTGVPTFTEATTGDPRGAAYGRTDLEGAALLAIPISSRTRRRGVIFVGDAPGRRYDPADLALATALGGELAMALESAELHAEARHRLAELSAIIDVARVVSSSLDLDRVLEMGAEHLKGTVGGDGCTVLLADHRAGVLRRAAWRGEPLEREAVPLDAPSLARDALASRAPASGRLDGEAGRAQVVLAVPLLVRDQPLGVALVSAPGAGRAFSHAELARAVAIASQLAVAVDNARLYSETRRRAEELSLLQDVGRTLVETLELGQVLTAGVRNLARMVDASEAYLTLLDEATQELVVEAVSGSSQALLGLRVPYDPAESATARCMELREPVLLDDAPTGQRADPDHRALSGMRSGLMLPLLVREKAIGAAVIVENRRARRFTAAEVQRATAVSNQLAVAVDNARAHARALAALADLQQAQEKLLRQERLAALGELSAVVAHEVRNPLGVIFNSLGSLRRLLRPEGDARVLLDIVGEEADRLNRIVGDLLDFARPAPPQLRPERLARLAEEAVAAALAQQPTSVEVARDLDPEMPPVQVDGRQVRQALLNVAANAVQAMPRGGRLTVRARLDGPAAVVEVEDTGAGIPADVMGRIFEPFFTTRATGSGLGLAVVKRIVDAHGGEVVVRSEVGRGTCFSLRFPMSPAPTVELGGRIG
jgi:PAS domain S-box-containing protein